MNAFSRTSSLLMARTGLAILVFCFAVCEAWKSADLRGQAPAQKKPRVEEEEETPKAKKPPNKRRVEEEEETPKKKSKPKVIRVEGDDDPKGNPATPRPSGSTASADLSQLAEQATHKGIKELFRSLAVPHDIVRFKRTPGVTKGGERVQREEKIVPSPFYLGDDPGIRHTRLQFTTLTDDGKKDKPFSPILENLESVRPYEQIAQNAVREFLREEYDRKEPDDRLYLSRYDMLVAAEQALSAVLRWHESARQTGQRRGEGWPPIETALRKQLLDEVLLGQMKFLAESKDWDKVLELAHRLAITYPNPLERAQIFRPVADMIQSALKDPTGNEAKKQQARKSLLELEQEFPNDPAFQPIIDTLRTQAQSFLRTAEESSGDGSDPAKLQKARAYLQRARETWPQLPELQALEYKLGMDYPILRVGVRGRAPQYLSPAWACTDNEWRAVDLLFESLVKQIPDEAGGYRYVPGLAQARPQVVPLGRRFELPTKAVWSDGQSINSTDLDVSLKLLQEGLGVGRSRVWGELLVGVERTRNPYQVTVRMKQGFLDPLALMSFKILPRDREVNGEEFATHPVSSGPYRLDPQRRSDERNRPCTIFIANPSYGLRPAKHGAPRIREIRFYTYANAVEELSKGTLDLALDLTAKEAQELLEKQTSERLAIEVPLPSSSVPNRRIYFLAINASKLPDVKLRRALAFAINREALLDKHFRTPMKATLHRALYGPFPPGSWACNPEVRDRANKNGFDLHDADKARALSQGATVPPLTLKYPSGDSALEEAMKELNVQVKTLTGIALEPTPCDPYQLREDVERTQSYDLAYYHYDYPDESFWLAPLLGPPPRAEGDKSTFKFRNASVSSLLAKVGNYRDFAEVRRCQWQLHELLNAEMPFVPLWQLDPLLAYRRQVHPSGLEPLRAFENIEEWRLIAK
jgi:ABC-type oligopeptide transport system substrate-binding subunit